MASLDPMSLNETFTLGFQGWFYETLAAYDKDLKLVPQLAEKWENPEPTKWIFHLRKGVKFHDRSEEHTSELQSLMRISYAVFCLKKKKHKQYKSRTHQTHKITNTPTYKIQ